MSTTQFIALINREQKAGQSAFLLRGNTSDYYFDPNRGHPPRGLHLTIAAHFPNHDVGYYSHSTGLMPLQRPDEVRQSAFRPLHSNRNAVESITEAIQILRGGEKRLLVLDFVDFLTPNGSLDLLHPDTARIIESLVRLATDNQLCRNDAFVVGITYNQPIHQLIESRWYPIDLPLPSESDRKQFYDRLASKVGFASAEASISDAELMTLSQGCCLRDIENVMRGAHAEGRGVTRDDFSRVRQMRLKAQVGQRLLIRKPSGLTFDDIAGMQMLKHFTSSVVAAIRLGQYGLAPSGILLQGPPGTGKTFAVDAIAAEFEYPIVEWRNMKSMWLGQSESNLDTALKAIEALNPCVVLIDEADQILNGRQEGRAGDGGAGGYMFGRLLTFMGDGRLRGRVVWVLCSNRPDLIDPALADRIGCCVPLLRPVRRHIPQILHSLARQLQVTLDVPESALTRLAQSLPQQVSVRKLKDVIGLAALHCGRDRITHENLECALDDVLFNEDGRKIEYWTLLAVRMATYARLLPWHDGDRVVPDDIPLCLSGLVDPTTGEMDATALDKRIFELSHIVGG